MPSGAGKPQALVVVPTRELCVQVTGDIAKAAATPPDPHPVRLRRPRLRAAGRGAEEGRRGRRRHPRPADRPGQPGPARPRTRPHARARRGRRDARPGLPARRGAHRPPGARGSPDDAVLGDHARPDRHPGPRATCTTRRTSAPWTRTTTARRSRPSSSTSSARTPWTRSRCSRASCRPTAAG